MMDCKTTEELDKKRKDLKIPKNVQASMTSKRNSKQIGKPSEDGQRNACIQKPSPKLTRKERRIEENQRYDLEASLNLPETWDKSATKFQFSV